MNLNHTATRALTVKQPWASLIASGAKSVENRTWPIPGTWAFCGPLLIHAGQGTDRAAWSPDRAAWNHPRVGRDLHDALGTDEIPTGAVVAVVREVTCHRAGPGCCTSPYAEPDCWHWELAGVTELNEPVPAKGKLGLWRPALEVLAAVGAELAERSAA